MSATPVRFSATGTIQTYLVAVAGTYLIEAAGGQGGAGASPGVKGARVSGMFYLKRDDLLKIVAGCQGAPATPPHHRAGGGGGSSLVWTGSSDLPDPIKLMLSARGGKGGTAAKASVAGEGDGDPPAPDLPGSIAHGAGIDQPTADALVTQWTRATESAPSPTRSGLVQVDRAGYNAGAFRTSTPAVQAGDGYVSITPVAVPGSSSPTDQRPARATAPAASDAPALAPASPPVKAGGSGSPPMGSPPAARDGQAGEAPSQTKLPRVTPRLRSWENLLRRRRRP